MEPSLTNSELVSQLSSPLTCNYLDKAWHFLALLLKLGRPAHTTELASRCLFFSAPPEFIEFLCKIHNSPLVLTEGRFVTISRVPFVAFARFVSSSNAFAVVEPRIALIGHRPRKIWEDVVRTYYRKRRREGSELERLPGAKRRGFRQNDDPKEDDRIVLALPEVCFHVDDYMNRNMIRQPGSTSVVEFNLQKPNDLLVAASPVTNFRTALMSFGEEKDRTQVQTDMFVNGKDVGCVGTPECQYHVVGYERLPRVPNAVTLEEIKACMLHPSPSLVNSTMEKPIVWTEAKMDALYSISSMDGNSPSCLEEDKTTKNSPGKVEDVVYVCKATTSKSAEDENVREGREEDSGSHNGDVEGLPITNMDMPCGNEFDPRYIDMVPSLDTEKTKAVVKSRAVFSAGLISVDQMQPRNSNFKTFQKDALNPKLLALCKAVENREAIGACTEQHQSKGDKSPISLKQKAKQNYWHKTPTKDKRENVNDNMGQNNNSMSLKTLSEPKSLPKFESFVVEDEEGSGGYGTVYRAQRRDDGATFAIKCPHVNANRHHVQNELKMLERFGGKNFVIKFEGSFKNGNSDCLVLEHVEHDRPEVLKKEIDVFQLQWYGYCLFRALAGLHKQGVVHRDVKPGNFLFSRKANKGYLIDFNLAVDLQRKYGTTGEIPLN
ncbi:hypothetical protein RJ640_012933 [Escallonia rubra]|uniref:non-specific serine/threonine protein kinase n=1 Tax=Escallonia rubra TaxID=112253 RepID=A0AA88RL57_9ASTE|nr:hypothetical protein RJ640_012933 [Escallonia rubra]